MYGFFRPKIGSDTSHSGLKTLLIRFGRGALFICLFVLVQISTAQAVPFTTDLQISGTVEFDDGFASADGDVTQTGDISSTVGTASTSSTFSSATPPGTNPLVATLTDIGDGFGMSANTVGSFDSEFALGTDINIDIFNNSLDNYQITFLIDYSNLVDADGSDAYVDSELTVDDQNGEVFFSDLLSDTFFGDEVGGNPTGNFGNPLLDNDMFYFDVLLGAGLSTSISSAWTMDGGVFASGGLANLDFEAFLSVYEVVNLSGGGPAPVPEPATLILFATGLLGLAVARRKGKREK